jgi:hypothetical protein|tara:strand:- start:364 stop:843 length:480 start_codon:yes stop_codon:yes gene_type:complete
MYDENNPDINLFNSVDDELISLAGSELLIYKFHKGGDHDTLYEEDRKKTIAQAPIVVVGHYDPRPIEENLTEFGIELTNDQMFTFNKAYTEDLLGRTLIPGDVIRPRFQNQKYEIFEVQEDRFDVYGVYHLLASAKLLRDNRDVQDIHQTSTEDEIYTE